MMQQQKRSLNISKKNLLTAGLIIISIFRVYYILYGPLDLSADEAHYWEWSRRLDLSYYSKGPLIAFLIHIGTFVFGNNVFGIRIMAVILSALSSIFIFGLVNLMYGNPSLEHPHLSPQTPAALPAALAFQAIPLFATFGVIFSIDSPFIFFWIVSLYFLYKATSQETKKQWLHWIVLGFAIGFGLLTKYTMAFFPLCSLLLLAFTDKRSLLRTPMPYVSVIISLCVFSPVIIWNAKHDWVTVRHTAGQAHLADGITLSLRNFFEFFGSQAGVVTPLFLGLMLYAIFKLFISDRRYQSKFLFYFFIPVLGFFLLKALQGKVEANWAMMGYVTGLIAAVQYSLNNHSKTRRSFLVSSLVLASLITLISHYTSLVGLPQKLDPSARLRGWKELGVEVSRLIAKEQKNTYYLLFSDSYQTSSELAFYVRGQPETFSINLGRRMNQYDLWPDINERAAKLRLEKSRPTLNGVFVMAGNREIPPAVAHAFDHYEKNVFEIHEDNGRVSKEYSIFICYNFKDLKIGKPKTF